MQRTRLGALLAEEHLQPLTLVSAPAGYGKSTLVIHWLDARPEPSAWLSLTEDDNALGQFLRYVVAAVRTVFPQACLSTPLGRHKWRCWPIPSAMNWMRSTRPLSSSWTTITISLTQSDTRLAQPAPAPPA
ncbi:MAG: hypothetical protein AB7P69_11590 [Candidatus Binatia bacterium]